MHDEQKSFFYSSFIIHHSSFYCRCVERLALGDNDNALLGHQEAAFAVVGWVMAEDGVRWYAHVLVDNRPANAAVPAHLDAVEQDRILDHGVTVDANARRQNTVPHVAAGDDAALRDH